MQLFVSIKGMEIQIEMSILTNYFIMKDIKLKEQMLGWTVLGRCSIDLTHQLQVGEALTI
jgi:hypothetical protein